MEEELPEENNLARWLAGELSAEEQKALEESEQLDALKVAVDNLDQWELTPMDLDKGLEELRQRRQDKPMRSIMDRASWLRIAAGVAILFSLGAYFWSASSRLTLVETDVAERLEVTLPAGSTVQMDAASTLRYGEKNWEKERYVELSGQAYFDVIKGSPFTVETETARVAVLGTQFNVKAEENRFAVDCYEGQIQVTYKKQTLIIGVGHTVELVNDRLIQGRHQEIVPSWFKGYSLYDRTSLKDIISDLQHYYEIEIILPEKYQDLKFTGRLDHTNLELALSTVFTTMELDYTKDKGKVLIK